MKKDPGIQLIQNIFKVAFFFLLANRDIIIANNSNFTSNKYIFLLLKWPDATCASVLMSPTDLALALAKAKSKVQLAFT